MEETGLELFRLLEEAQFKDVTWLRSVDRQAEIETFLPADNDDAPEIGVLYVGQLEQLPPPRFGISCLCPAG